MKKMHTTGFFLFALPFLFTGVLSLQGTLFGNAKPQAYLTMHADTLTVGGVDSANTRPSPSLNHYHSITEAVLLNPHRLPLLKPEEIDTETLWLARGIYSETKRPEEQELVAWVIRNRVETRYRGKRTYRGVVLDPFQFSAFNPDSRKGSLYRSLSPQSKVAGWQRALSIAYHVRQAPGTYRPFSLQTRHFYSERSMVGSLHPDWASGRKPVKPVRHSSIDERRFRFYEGIS